MPRRSSVSPPGQSHSYRKRTTPRIMDWKKHFRKTAAAIGLALVICGLISPAPARGQYKETDLVADLTGHAPNVDPLLINPWSMVIDRGLLVVADPGPNEIPGSGG